MRGWRTPMAVCSVVFGAGPALRHSVAARARAPSTVAASAHCVNARAAARHTREFFHARSQAFVRGMRVAAGVLGFALPVLVLAASRGDLGAAGLAALFALQYLGLLAERWVFFVDGRHPQNLYYGATS